MIYVIEQGNSRGVEYFHRRKYESFDQMAHGCALSDDDLVALKEYHDASYNRASCISSWDTAFAVGSTPENATKAFIELLVHVFEGARQW